jgi:hypothetical protein
MRQGNPVNRKVPNHELDTREYEGNSRGMLRIREYMSNQ